MTTALAVEPLTAHDRCDSCCAQAKVRVHKLSNRDAELLFCDHHKNANFAALVLKGWSFA